MARDYQYILFDLDGTITESAPGITRCAQFALEQYGIHAELDDLLCFIGPPLRDSFMQFYGLTYEQADEAVQKYYRARYREKGIYEFNLYDGVPEMVKALHAAGKTVLLATSKPEAFAKTTIEHAGLMPYFSIITGSNFDGTREGKDEVIRCVFERAGITDLSKAVMVGDRHFDMVGAKQCGIDCIGALYGYGSEQELSAAGATYLAATPADVVKIILG